MFNRSKKKHWKIISPRRLTFGRSSSISDSLAECSLYDTKGMDSENDQNKAELEQLIIRKKKLMVELNEISKRINYLTTKINEEPDITLTPIGVMRSSVAEVEGPPAHSSAYDRAKHRLDDSNESLPSPITLDETFTVPNRPSFGEISILRESNESGNDGLHTPDNCKSKNDRTYVPTCQFSSLTPFKLYSHWSKISGTSPIENNSVDDDSGDDPNVSIIGYSGDVSNASIADSYSAHVSDASFVGTEDFNSSKDNIIENRPTFKKLFDEVIMSTKSIDESQDKNVDNEILQQFKKLFDEESTISESINQTKGSLSSYEKHEVEFRNEFCELKSLNNSELENDNQKDSKFDRQT